jgi:hypothetical protein
MCSVSWVRRRDSLLVVMNRDERRDRAPARPPRRWRRTARLHGAVDGDAGGTWIAAKDSGVVLRAAQSLRPVGSASFRRRCIRRRSDGARTSEWRSARGSAGLLVTTLAADTRRLLARRGRPGSSFAPFRLFVSVLRVAPRVFTWDGAALSARRLDPRLGFLTSSSWNARAVIPARHARFAHLPARYTRPARRRPRRLHAAASDHARDSWGGLHVTRRRHARSA